MEKNESHTEVLQLARTGYRFLASLPKPQLSWDTPGSPAPWSGLVQTIGTSSGTARGAVACAAQSLVPLLGTTAVPTAPASLGVSTQVRSQKLSGGRTRAQLCSLHSSPPSWGQVASVVVPSACAENPPCLEQKCMITSHLSYLTENTEGPQGTRFVLQHEHTYT